MTHSAENDTPAERRMTEFGFMYDGSPEWSSHAYVKWSQEAAEHYRQDAILWRAPEKVGGLIRRERVSYADSVSEWECVIPPAEPCTPESPSCEAHQTGRSWLLPCPIPPGKE